ncbi:MAG: S8 family serine peptidase, partial [Clostridiales bacterium]|nr:S8 family serine peptidase [Clostridiales bacterium]
MKRILSVFLAFLLSISVTRAEIPRGIYISGDFLGDSMRLVRENQLNPDGEEGMFATRRLILCAEDLSKSYHEFDYTDIVRDSEGFVVLQFGSGEDAEDAYNQLLADDEIEFVEPDILFHVFDEVVDEYNAQAEFSAADVAHNSWGVARIGAGEYADALIANGQGNEAQIVAVVDTGIDTTHSIFTDRVVSGRNTFSNNYNYADGHGHGTHVSGTILDVTRSLPNVKIMPIKALDNNGDGSSITIAAGINWAVDNGADVVNLSLTGTGAPGNFINAYYAKAIQAGVSAVAAAGNDNIVTDNVVPAGIEYSITVAATGNSLHADVKASFSNYGDAVDVAAPGYGILSAHLSGLTATMNGTSMAAPHVSGAVAMLRIRHPEATAAQIEEFVRLYTDDLGTAGWDKYFGYGILNLQKALDESGDFIDGGSTEPEIPVPTYGVSFEANGGTPGPGTQSVPLDGLVLKPTSPVKSGFTFAGWFTSGSLETLWDFTSDTVSGAMTLYAKWIEVITIDGIPKHEYTGEEIEPSVTVRQGAKTLEESVDYTVSYNDNLSLGMALAKISFIGDYLGVDMMSVEFEIVTVDEEYNSVAGTLDGGYVVVGEANRASDSVGYGNNGNYDAIIVKYDVDDNVVWTKNAGGGDNDSFYDVVAMSDGSIVAVGESDGASTSPGWGNNGDADAVIVKYNSAGGVVWSKNAGGDEYDAFRGVTETSDGGIIAVGISNSSSGPFPWGHYAVYDAIIVKYDSSGNMVWAHHAGGISIDAFEEVAAVNDGGCIAVGYSFSTSTVPVWGNSGAVDGIIVRYAANGDVVWSKNIGGTGYDYFDSIAATVDGGFAVVGVSDGAPASSAWGNNGDNDAIIVKYDSAGNVLWAGNVGGANAEEFCGVAATSDGGAVAVGYSYSESTLPEWGRNVGADDVIVKYDAAGNASLAKNVGGSGDEVFFAVAEIANGSYIAAGYAAKDPTDSPYYQNYSRTAGITADFNYVDYDANGGAPEPTPQMMTADGTVEQPTGLVNAGLMFAGWFVDSSFVTLWNFASYVVTGAVTFYARWISEITIDSVPNQEHTGGEIKPIITVRQGFSELTVDQDYEVDYSDNVDIGTATVEISFKGDYLGVEPMSVGFE